MVNHCFLITERFFTAWVFTVRLLAAWLATWLVLAQSSLAQTSFSGPAIFYDAQRTGLSNETKVLEGEVVVIAASTILTADKVVLDSEQGRLDAVGHVLIIGQNQIFSGSEITYSLSTGDFVIKEALMISYDAQRIEQLRSEVLGFTEKELAFEENRKRRLAEIAEEKQSSLAEAREYSLRGDTIPEALIARYAVLLSQEELVRSQENPALARLSANRRQIYKSRRQYWEQSRKEVVQLGPTSNMVDAYFRLEGDTITRTDGNDYLAQRSLFTPCKCDDDEDPAWGFRADKAFAQQGGYIDLYHPVLEIKGIPVLYLPYLKLPIKDQRQSGFLMPTLSFDKASGNIYSQPIYFDFAPNADATLYTDVFEERGTRLGLEFRYQQRRYSGWEFRVEALRDRLWLDQRGLRQDLGEYYSEGLTAAEARLEERNAAIAARQEAEENDVPGDEDAITIPSLGSVREIASVGSDKEWTRLRLRQPDFWAKNSILGKNCLESDANSEECRRDFDKAFAVPQNTWRGQVSFRGLTYLAPRLSFVSHGEVVSDHRYADQLYLPDDLRESFYTDSFAKSFSATKGQLHLDNPDFYLGLGSKLGDNVLLYDRFAGQQMPLRFKAQSRMVSLISDSYAIPVYGIASYEHYRILDLEDSVLGDTLETELGDGTWRRLRFDTISPLLSDTTISVSHFAQTESRYIEAAGLGQTTSERRSFRTGFDFRLPIDGKGRLPSLFQDPENPLGGERHLHHLMDWGLRFSLRPNVVSRGPYGDPDVLGGDLAYFTGDGFNPAAADPGDVPEDLRLVPHQRITFLTHHRWRLFERSWDVVPGAPPEGSAKTDLPKDEQARRELLYSLDRPVGSSEDMFSGDGRTWYINRYKMRDNYFSDPLAIGAQVTYDVLRVEEREEGRRLNRQLAAAGERPTTLAEPWIGPILTATVRAGGFSLDNYLDYNVYRKKPQTLAFSLGLPAVLKTNVSFGYTIANELEWDSRAFDFEDRITRTRSTSVVSDLVPAVQTFFHFTRKEVDKVPYNYTSGVEMRYGFEYRSPSECWGLRFLRKKHYEKPESAAEYLLQLTVIFLGREERALPDIAPGVVREFQVDDNLDDE